jgi:5-methyltetrahydropteroyltriglutamate--homocysteine methyltransferase
VIALQESIGWIREPGAQRQVQYFAEQLTGYLRHHARRVLRHRYVRPPIIAGDVSRPAPMTVDCAVSIERPAWAC